MATKVRELEHKLGSRQGEIDRLADDLNSAKSNNERASRSSDKERSKLQQRISSLSKELKACKDEVKELRATLEEGISLNASLRSSGKESERQVKHLRCRLRSMDNVQSEVQTLRDEVSKKHQLNRNLSARLEVSSTLEQRDIKLDQMLDTVAKMNAACEEYEASESSKLEELNNELTLREKSLLSTKKELEGKLHSLTDDWRSLQKSLTSLVACMRNDNEDPPSEEALPEMTSLLSELFASFQGKVDQVGTLESQLQELRADKVSEVESLVKEIEYVRLMQFILLLNLPILLTPPSLSVSSTKSKLHYR